MIGRRKAGVAAGGKSKAAPKRNWREEIGDEDFSDHDVRRRVGLVGEKLNRKRDLKGIFIILLQEAQIDASTACEPMFLVFKELH